MKLEKYIDQRKIKNVSGLFFVKGSFGWVESEAEYMCIEIDNKKVYEYKNDHVKLWAEFTSYPNGVVIRRDFLQNISKNPIELNQICSRFTMDGNAYDVYTQYNGWQHESTEGWQRLVTQVTTASQGIRTCEGATPIMALYNLYNGRNTVFHLLPNCQWRITARKTPILNKLETVVVEMGPEDSGLHLMLASDEIMHLPTIIFYEAENKVDLDAYKLHEIYNELFPRKHMPIMFNSWLCCFDVLDVDELLKQVDAASELGIEMFMIDAGWFGDGAGWSERVGDWSENLQTGPKGRLIEISQRAREKGMIFGLWFEPERAGTLSETARQHPDYYIDGRFFDFSNKEACDYMVNIISQQIDKYKIGWAKFDFNDSIPFDVTGNAFYRYIKGKRYFIEQIRNKYPELYITGCASGGYQMELAQGLHCDSFWFTDNQGPYDGIRIIKDTLKRMPTALIERWNVQQYCEGFLEYQKEEKRGWMLSCNNATWDFVLNVKDSFVENFVAGGPLGFSCDIASFPDTYKQQWKEFIKKYKQEREFYINATARILVDSTDIIAIQYSDKNLKKCIVQVFTKVNYAETITVYPVVDITASYSYKGTVISGKDIEEDGLSLRDLQDNACVVIGLIKIDD